MHSNAQLKIYSRHGQKSVMDTKASLGMSNSTTPYRLVAEELHGMCSR